MTQTPAATTPRKTLNPWLKFALELGPLALFFIAYGRLGIFVATSLSTIEPTVLPALIVPALTAALVGGFISFPRTTLAAFVLGMQKPLIAYLGVNKSWFPKSQGQAFPGVDRVLPIVVIVLVLYLAGDALPAEAGAGDRELPR